MRWTIIVASNDGAQLEQLHDAALSIQGELPAGNHRILEAASVSEVMHQRNRVVDAEAELLIVAANLIDGRRATLSEEHGGFSLVSTLQELTVNTPACILVSHEHEYLPKVQLMPRCELLFVSEGLDYIRQSKQLARRLGVLSGTRSAATFAAEATSEKEPRSATSDRHAPRARTPQPGSTDRYAWLDLKVTENCRSASIQLTVVDRDNYELGDVDPMPLEPTEVQDIVKRSRDLTDWLSKVITSDLDEHRHWEKKYRDLGERIYRLLWRDTFVRSYERAKGIVGDSNVRIRFNLASNVLDGLWEAAFNTGIDRYFMAEDTMVRRVSRRLIETFPIPDDRGDVLRVLVIKSSVPDGSTPDGPNDLLWREYLGDTGSQLHSLTHLDDEVDALRALARKRGRKADIGSPGRARKLSIDTLQLSQTSAKPRSLADRVKEVLHAEPGRYDIVLFAGHALFDRGRDFGDDRGYLVFSGYPNPVAVPVAVVAGWLKKAGVQLVHLSCCKSSAARAATELAHHGIPMVIGFTWDLDDSRAVDFTELFYTALLNDSRLNVCAAFASTRRELRGRYDRGDSIWASPVLIAQPLKCNHVEGMLRIPLRKLVSRKAIRHREKVVPLGKKSSARLPGPAIRPG